MGLSKYKQILATDLKAQSKTSVLLFMEEGRDETGDEEMDGRRERSGTSQHYPAFGSESHPDGHVP